MPNYNFYFFCQTFAKASCLLQKSAHAGAHVRNAMGVPRGLHGATGDAQDAARPLTGECAPHYPDGTGGATLVSRHSRGLTYT